MSALILDTVYLVSLWSVIAFLFIIRLKFSILQKFGVIVVNVCDTKAISYIPELFTVKVPIKVATTIIVKTLAAIP